MEENSGPIVNSGQFVECIHDRGFVRRLLMNRKPNPSGLTNKQWDVPAPMLRQPSLEDVRVPWTCWRRLTASCTRCGPAAGPGHIALKRSGPNALLLCAARPEVLDTPEGLPPDRKGRRLSGWRRRRVRGIFVCHFSWGKAALHKLFRPNPPPPGEGNLRKTESTCPPPSLPGGCGTGPARRRRWGTTGLRR